MTLGPAPEVQDEQIDPATSDAWVRLGERLFRRRTSVPTPIILALLVIPGPPWSTPLFFSWVAGAALVCTGELLRLWAVRHIGVISRTRSDRLGPLVASGPFSLIRNPLYVGNIALWVGFTLSAGMIWLVPIVLVFLAVVYHAIVRWEETLLEARRGDVYREYKVRVPRWIPPLTTPTSPTSPTGTTSALFSWGDTLFSERGTLIAIVVGYGLLYLKFWSG